MLLTEGNGGLQELVIQGVRLPLLWEKQILMQIVMNNKR